MCVIKNSVFKPKSGRFEKLSVYLTLLEIAGYFTKCFVCQTVLWFRAQFLVCRVLQIQREPLVEFPATWKLVYCLNLNTSFSRKMQSQFFEKLLILKNSLSLCLFYFVDSRTGNFGISIFKALSNLLI